MNDYISKQLDKVLLLNQQKKQALSTIKETKTKKFGLYQVNITHDDKVQMASKVRRFYDAKISTIYNNMNLELKETGQEELTNPYETIKKGEN